MEGRADLGALIERTENESVVVDANHEPCSPSGECHLVKRYLSYVSFYDINTMLGT